MLWRVSPVLNIKSRPTRVSIEREQGLQWSMSYCYAITFDTMAWLPSNKMIKHEMGSGICTTEPSIKINEDGVELATSLQRLGKLARLSVTAINDSSQGLLPCLLLCLPPQSQCHTYSPPSIFPDSISAGNIAQQSNQDCKDGSNFLLMAKVKKEMTNKMGYDCDSCSVSLLPETFLW